jgi:hypothetical protein
MTTHETGCRSTAPARVLSAFVLAGLASSLEAQERWRVDLEGGLAWAGRAEFAVPGDTGTRVDLADSDPAPKLAPRVTLTWSPTSRWSFRVLAAPLKFDGQLVPAQPVSFDGTLFPAGQPLSGSYRFDSYRLSCYYRFRPGARWSFRLGLTGKIRSAETTLSGGGRSDSYDNVGFVPLIYGGVRFQAHPRLGFDLELDALGAPQGRAEDLALKAEWVVTDGLAASVGYRVVEGGADNDKVYTFALFHYAVVGLSYRF